ncbi:response regulator transcription factor [Kiritimatiellaeota bacterium B1221]|nr:response regulator transcription factor [Kiritimatiellaeota bacterium B1221]
MNEAIRILVVEDDVAIRRGLVDTLESENYQVGEAVDGREGLEILKKESPDLLILDLMMPGMSGYEVCREFRTRDKQTPVLMLTAKSEEIDKVLGLELGADDYMTKPFGVRELLARVHALLRRSQRTLSSLNDDEFVLGPFKMCPKKLTGSDGEKQIEVSAREMDLLKYFAARPNEVLSRDELLNHAWGVEYYGTTRTLDQHIAQLRKKVEADRKDPQLLQTVHGVGYRYCPPVG